MALTDLGAGTNNSNPAVTCALTGGLAAAINDGETAWFALDAPNTNPTGITLTIGGTSRSFTEAARSTRTSPSTETVLLGFKNTTGSTIAAGTAVSVSWTNSGTQSGGGAALTGIKTDQDVDPTTVSASGTGNGASGTTPNATTSSGPPTGSDDYVVISSVMTKTTSNPTGPTGWTTSSGGVNSTRAVTGIMAGKELTAPGTGTQSVTWGSTVGGNWAATIAMFKVIAATAPTFTASPVVSGTAAVGSTLSTTDGTTDDPTATFSYQWRRDVGTSGATWVDIEGATSSSYVVTADDLGSAIRCDVVATNGTGSSAPEASNATSSVPAPAGELTYRVVAGPVAQSDNQVHTNTLALPVLPGDLVVLFAACSNANTIDGNGNQSDVGSVTDDGAHTWTQDSEAFSDTNIQHSAQAFSAQMDDGLAYGSTITMTVDGGVGAGGYHGQSPFWYVVAISTGDTRVLTLDAQAHSVDLLTSHAAPSVTTTNDDAVVFGFAAATCASLAAAGWWTPAAGFDEFVDTASADASGGESQYQIAGEAQVTTTGYTGGAGGTTGSNKTVTNLVVAYSTAPAGGTLVTGAASLALTLDTTTAAHRATFAAASEALTLTQATAGRRTANASSSTVLAFTMATAARRVAKASSSLALAFTPVTAARRVAKAAASLPLTLTIATSGVIGAVIEGASSLALAFTSGVSGLRRANASASQPLTLSVTTAARRRALASSSTALAFSVTASGMKRTRAAASLALSFVVGTAGHVGALAHAALTKRAGIRLTGTGRRGIRRDGKGRNGVNL